MAKKMGLGRGLSAILPDVEEVVESVGHQLPTTIVPADAVVELNLGDIDPNRDQPRKKFDDEFREALTQKQNNKCAVCGKNILSRTSHLDHIIPWDYVGDNLSDNYQMLCETCNTRKGTSTYFEISMLLLNK